MNPQSLKEFIKRFRAALLPDASSPTPLILLEFKSEDEAEGFRSRIELCEIPRDDVVKYRYVERQSENTREWPLRSNEYEILNIVPPARSLVASRNRSLAIIQVGK